MEEKVYWFITTFNYKLDSDCWDFAKITTSRCWGFYTNKEDALNVLHNNMTDLWETIYPYAVLEPYCEGVCGYCFEEPRQFFAYDPVKNGYFEIETPVCFEHLVGFGLC